MLYLFNSLFVELAFQIHTTNHIEVEMRRPTCEGRFEGDWVALSGVEWSWGDLGKSHVKSFSAHLKCSACVGALFSMSQAPLFLGSLAPWLLGSFLLLQLLPPPLLQRHAHTADTCLQCCNNIINRYWLPKMWPYPLDKNTSEVFFGSFYWTYNQPQGPADNNFWSCSAPGAEQTWNTRCRRIWGSDIYIDISTHLEQWHKHTLTYTYKHVYDVQYQHWHWQVKYTLTSLSLSIYIYIYIYILMIDNARLRTRPRRRPPSAPASAAAPHIISYHIIL